MGRLSLESRQSVVILWKSGMKLRAIRERLAEEGTTVSVRALYKLTKKFAMHGRIADFKRKSRDEIFKSTHYEFIDKWMYENDELTAYALLNKLKNQFPDIKPSLSLETVRRGRRKLGWVSTTPKYCQLIREVNKDKNLAWCKEQKADETFDNVIWSDECSVQLEAHSLRCYRKEGQPKKLKPRPKHPLKIHIWGGISSIFSGKLCATKLVKIFDAGLLEFVKENIQRDIVSCRTMTPSTPQWIG